KLTLASTTNGAHGTAKVADGKLTYTPDKGWAGDDTVTYTVTDGKAEATGTLTVTTKPAPPVNKPPVANPDKATTGYGQQVTADVLGNDSDPDGDKLTLASTTNGAHGTTKITDGKLTYTPDKGWAGDDTVTYTVTDGRGGTATGTLTITTNVPQQDLGLSVSHWVTGVNQRFEVTTTGITADVPADLVVTWTDFFGFKDVKAPEFCDEVGDHTMVCHLTGPTDPFEIRFMKFFLGFSVRMELKPLAPYVDPTPNIYRWP
ncbi:MAG: Ig-like domain-containing protein, partial [Nocardioides sp.]